MAPGSCMKASLVCAIGGAGLATALVTRHVPEGSVLSEVKTHASICASLSKMPSCDGSPWRPSSKAKVKEICAKQKDGSEKSLPKLYVLGAQKAGTSSMAADLSCTGIYPVPGSDDKEMHFFDGHSKWRGDDEEYANWLERLPECGEKAKIRNEQTDFARMVTDFTPNNLRMVAGETSYSGVKIEVPEKIKSWYPDKTANELTFVMTVREPLSRMQSAWYAASMCNNDFHSICKDDCRAPSFKDALKGVLRNATRKEPLFTEWIWTSMYGRHLKEWLKHFKAKQFYVIPYKEYSEGDADSICRSLSKKMDFEMDCESNGKGVTHLWASEHPSLEDDMTPELQSMFDEVMDHENKAFVNLLAEASMDGMTLANYKGEAGDKKAIRKWLQAGW